MLIANRQPHLLKIIRACMSAEQIAPIIMFIFLMVTRLKKMACVKCKWGCLTGLSVFNVIGCLFGV